MPADDEVRVAKRTWEMMQCGSKELFNHEVLSDAKVTANGVTWHVHKSIICPRSEFFRKAFMSPHNVSITNEHTIIGQSTKAVEHILRYLYTGELNWQEDFMEIREAVDLFVAATYFGIEHLKDEGISAVKASFERLVMIAETDCRNGPLLWNEDLDEVVYAVRLAFASDSDYKPLRGPVEEFLTVEDFLLTKDDRFMREVKDIPEFAWALVKLMGSPHYRSEMTICSNTTPTMICGNCQLYRAEFAENTLIVYPEYDPTKSRVLGGTCTECFEAQEREWWRN